MLQKKFKLLTLLLAAVLLIGIKMPASAGSMSRVVIEDDADLLTDEEEEKLAEVMLPITDYGYVCFKSIDVNSTSTSSYVKDYYHENFGKSSGLVFLIDMDNRNIWIFSDGDIYDMVTTSKANTITDNAYKKATNEDYYGCAEIVFTQIYKVLNGEKVVAPMKYVGNALLAIAIALFINYFVVKALSSTHKISREELVKGKKKAFSFDTPRAKHTSTSRRYNPHTDSSDGGGSSGGGGGGGSSGGGGGHGF